MKKGVRIAACAVALLTTLAVQAAPHHPEPHRGEGRGERVVAELVGFFTGKPAPAPHHAPAAPHHRPQPRHEMNHAAPKAPHHR